MNRKRLLIALAALLIAACGENVRKEVPKIYTAEENKLLTYCMALSTTASNAATDKLSGKTEREVKQFYKGKSQENVNIQVVEEIYLMQENSIWAYTVNFFKNCANIVAKVETSRVYHSDICMQRQFVGDIAHGLKNAGQSKAQAYSVFSSQTDAKINEIIDFVYESNFTRAEVKKLLWHPCIDQYTRK